HASLEDGGYPQPHVGSPADATPLRPGRDRLQRRLSLRPARRARAAVGAALARSRPRDLATVRAAATVVPRPAADVSAGERQGGVGDELEPQAQLPCLPS